MTNLPQTDEHGYHYARRTRKAAIKCWRQHCRFCFGRVVDGHIEIDPGFVRTFVDDDAANTGLRFPHMGFKLGSNARPAYQKAKRAGTLDTFVAAGRHNKKPTRVTPDDRFIECPEHGWQVIVPGRLGCESPSGVERAHMDRRPRYARLAVHSHWERYLEGIPEDS